MFWIKSHGGSFNRSNLAQNFFELLWVEKYHFGYFSERAGMAVPC
jgi:hypothetical protein